MSNSSKLMVGSNTAEPVVVENGPKSRLYKHTLVQVHYSRENGYRWEPRALPDWIHIEIVDKENSKVVYVCSRIHVNKRERFPTGYSNEFSDYEILRDVSGEVLRMWVAH